MTAAAKSLLLTLRISHWINATGSTRCSTEPTAIRELQRLGMVVYHSPMNAWFITDAGKMAANKFQSQLERTERNSK